MGIATLVSDEAVVFANNSAINTLKTVDMVNPDFLSDDALYSITVFNPSTETDLTVIVRNREEFGTTNRYPELTRFTVPRNTPEGQTRLVQGLFGGESSRLVVQNLTALSGAGGFTANVRVRRL